MSKRKDQEAVIFRLKADVKKKLQMKVLEEGTSVQELLENFIHDYLEMGEDKMVLEGIIKVAQENTDFESGFDYLFGFMAENPNSATTESFISYHIDEMNSPVASTGEPEFTYLIGREFIAEHWVSEEDTEAFTAYVTAYAEKDEKEENR